MSADLIPLGAGPMDPDAADTIVYERLIDHLCQLEPAHGYRTISQMGDFDLRQVIAVLSHEHELIECTVSGTSTPSLLCRLRNRRPDMDPVMVVGLWFMDQLTASVRSYVLDEVIAELARREEERHQDALPSRFADDHGAESCGEFGSIAEPVL